MDTDPQTEAAQDLNDTADWFEHKLRHLFEAVIDELPNALDPTQIVGIHDMRVATRRLRSALRDVELILGKRLAKAASQGFKALADSLGAVRDEDVAIGEFERILALSEDQHIIEGITKLIEAHRERRERAFRQLRRDLSVDFQQDLRRRFETSLAGLVAEFERTEQPDIKSFGRDVAAHLLTEIDKLGAGLHDPFDRKTLHQARIATKRLRYAIARFSECWDDRIKPFSKELARMQGYLGDAHDRDVWIDDLRKHINVRLTNGHGKPDDFAAAWAISEFVVERTTNYRDALKLWADWQNSDFAGALLTLVSERDQIPE